MPKLLLLYDTDDKDFARDVQGLLEELDIEVAMIPCAPDGGLTLQGKEEKFFDAVEGALLLITPGSERHGKKYPSPSVADEMGQAKRRFVDEPWRVIYLVDRECNIQAVDQRAYIDFARTDHRSVIEAVRRLVAALKDAALLPGRVPAPAQNPPEIDIAALAAQASPAHRHMCLRLAEKPNGVMSYIPFVEAAGTVMSSQADGNLLVRELMQTGVVMYQAPATQGLPAIAYLSAAGWDLVRVLRAIERLSADGKLRAALRYTHARPAGSGP